MEIMNSKKTNQFIILLSTFVVLFILLGVVSFGYIFYTLNLTDIKFPLFKTTASIQKDLKEMSKKKMILTFQ